MNFWDTSAILPLIISEKTSPAMMDLRERSDGICVWTLSSIEGMAAIARLRRMNLISAELHDEANKKLKEIFAGFNLITDVEAVKISAERVLRIHSLKAADSMQLAAALVACLHQPSAHTFMTLDKQLAQAALKEGFDVLPS